jgi:hypothetical protein
MENQLVGGGIISLLVAAPLAAAAGILWLRGHRAAPMLALGPSLYAVYMYFQFIVGPEYHRYDGNNEYAFPLYLALIVLGWVVAVGAWTALTSVPVPPIAAGLRKSFAMIVLLLNTGIALAWSAGIADVLDGGAVAAEYEADSTLFWVVKTMDLAVVVPVAFIMAIGLLRGAAWAIRLVYALAGFQTLLTGAVAGMAIAMAVRDDPAANPVFLVATATFTLVLAAMLVRFLRNVASRQDGSSSTSYAMAVQSSSTAIDPAKGVIATPAQQ